MSADLRRAFGHYPTGVTIITTSSPTGDPIGMTANSFASLSLEPPLVLWSIARTSGNFNVFCAARYFAVHVLHAGQSAMARRFALKEHDRFAGLPTTSGQSGAPILDDYHAVFDCITHDILEGGDHAIVVGRVLYCDERPGDPLIFYKGRFVGQAVTIDLSV